MFLDAGEEEAIFVQTLSSRQVLVDGEPSERALLSQLDRRMPFGDRRLDPVLLTHPDLDHITGLVPVLERYRVDTVVFRQLEVEYAAYDYRLQLLEAEGATVYRGGVGPRPALDGGLDMVVLYPGAELVSGEGGSANNNLVVTRLTYRQVSVLLTGDTEAPVEHQLVAEGGDACKHGAEGSPPREFQLDGGGVPERSGPGGGGHQCRGRQRL